MDLTAVRLFVTVVRRGSFAAAAREADLDPSAVSRTIAGLERELGVRLFQRSTRRLTPTEAGERWFARVEALADEFDRAADEARGVAAGPTGVLRLTASVSFGQRVIVPLLPWLRARHPALAVEAILTDATLDLIAERIDLAVRLAPTVEGDLIVTRLMDTRYRVVAAPGWVAAAGPLGTPADLACHDCLLLPLRGYRSQWLFRDRAGRVETVPVRGGVVLSPAVALRDAAIAGMGPALLADWLVDEDVAAGRLVRLFPEHDVTATTFDTAAWLVYPSRRHVPAKVRAAIEVLRAGVRRPG